jgi:hypothetical protein
MLPLLTVIAVGIAALYSAIAIRKRLTTTSVSTVTDSSQEPGLFGVGFSS